MKKWKASYKDNKIVVENRISSERLYVNGELQDESIGFFAMRVRLFGSLASGEKIKVSIGSRVRTKCMIFINDEFLLRGE